MMTFHFMYKGEALLFSGWVSNSPGAYLLTLLICFSVALFSEFWATYRHSINIEKSESFTGINSNHEENERLIGINKSKGQHNNNNTGKFKTLLNAFLKSHIYKTIVHMIAFVINYTIMLMFMSFNVGIAISIVLGVGLGYYLFASKRYTQSVAVVEDLCH